MTLPERIALQLPGGCTPHTYLALAVATRVFPGERPGQNVSPNTVYRWGTKGLPLPDGRVVRLRIWRLGRKYVTTPEAIADFVVAQQPSSDETRFLSSASV